MTKRLKPDECIETDGLFRFDPKGKLKIEYDSQIKDLYEFLQLAESTDMPDPEGIKREFTQALENIKITDKERAINDHNCGCNGSSREEKISSNCCQEIFKALYFYNKYTNIGVERWLKLILENIDNMSQKEAVII